MIEGIWKPVWPHLDLWLYSRQADREEIAEVLQNITYFSKRVDANVFNPGVADHLRCVLSDLKVLCEQLKERYKVNYGWTSYLFG